jgi:hypothetical protein
VRRWRWPGYRGRFIQERDEEIQDRACVEAYLLPGSGPIWSLGQIRTFSVMEAHCEVAECCATSPGDKRLSGESAERRLPDAANERAQ